MQRYEKPFKLFWAFCKIKNVDAEIASLSQVASLLWSFDKIFPNQSRFAFSSLLLIPGLEQLTFNPLLRQLKRKWNISQVRYGTFYDASDPLQHLMSLPLKWDSVEDVRLRLILCCRFLMFARNVDLSRMYRTFSFVNGKPFILIQRKGWLKPQWEAMVTIRSCPSICP